MHVLDARATAAALPFGALIEALHGAFADGARVQSPPRHVHSVSAAAGGGGGFTSLLMPAWGGGLYGVKVVNIAPANAARGLPGVHAGYLLFDGASGVPLALLDGGVLTSRRTAATAALAARHLARPGARRLLVVGAGQVAALLPAAFCAALPAIDSVTVWARSPVKAEALAAALRAEGGVAVEVAPQLESAVRSADIVSCATLATAPLVHGRWLTAGSHLDLIGSFTPAMREADDACFDGGAVLLVDELEALVKSGDLVGRTAADVQGTLAALLRGDVGGRQSAHGRTVFKSVGSARADLAAATLVWQHLR